MLELNQIWFLNLRFEIVLYFLIDNWSWFFWIKCEYDNMDLSFDGIISGLNHRGMIWWAALCYPVHRAESRGAVKDAHVLGVEILMKRYSGFPHGTMGMVLVFVHPAVPTAIYVLHILFSTSSGRRNKHVPFLCSTYRVPPLTLSRHSPRPGV